VGELADHGIALVRAGNPGPLTLSGTNTWLVGRERPWVVDPGPALDAHLDAVAAAVAARGGPGGIALTHDHADHAGGLDGLLDRLGGDVPVLAGGGPARAGGPFEVLPLPGHADDHVVLVAGAAAFTGDAVLGAGSVFVQSRLAEYLDGLRRLRALGLALLCPGHGPPVWDVRTTLDGYLEHRLERERRLLAALERGLRGEDELLDEVWADAPPALRPVAAITLRAHLEKLREDGAIEP
jgi:glyoxylase-like metal-dependent hydrolase (beta-lactamase superfamily II)